MHLRHLRRLRRLRHPRRAAVGACLAAAAAALAGSAWLAAHPSDAWACGPYVALSDAVGFLPGLVPFSVAEWVIVAATVVAVVYLARSVAAVVRAGRGSRLAAAGRRAVPAAAAVAAAWALFMALQGLNYSRPTFAELAGYGPALQEVHALPAEERAERLTSLCEELGRRVDESRAALGPVSDGWLRSRPSATGGAAGDFPAMARAATSQVRALNDHYPGLFAVGFSDPKPVLASRAMSLVGITGVYFPYTAEANVSCDWPRLSIPATMGHELAHRAGFMREDEANYIGYLACAASDDPLARYSGYTMAYDEAMAALRRADPEAWARIHGERGLAVAGDRAARADMAAGYRGPLQDLGDAVNDGYLKANGQRAGTASYSLMVDLLLADPALRA